MNGPAVHELLVVDDNPATRYSTSRVLRAAGYTVREAGTGAEALRLADEHVAGVVLDVHLPDMNGFEVCKLLRERPATLRIPVIHLSAAYVGDTDKVRGLHSGADAYMTHPAEPALLVATLQALIRARTAEEGMRRSEARFRAIYHQASSGIALVDTEGRFVDCNPALLSLLGREIAEVTGAALADFVPADGRATLNAALVQARASTWRGDFPLRSGRGVDVPMEWTFSAHTEPGQLLAMATDISDRIELQRQREDLLEREQAARAAAERLNRSKDEFIAVLSHELRTPLNAIVSWVHVLKRLDADASMARGLDSIERNAHVQTRLVSDILDMSRMDLGKLQLFIEPVDVPELVRIAVNTLGASARDKSLDVVVEMDTVARHVNADASRLQQIVWNLLTNAIKFSNPGGRIRVAATQDGAALSLSVSDEGIGIRPEFAEQLFERFTQGDSGSNRTHGGLGLGLSIVKHLVELHGGDVTAFSEGPGRGSTFTVTIPAGLEASGLIAAPGRPPEHDATARTLSTVDVLVVDDDPEAREMLTMILSERGARVTAAVSAADGLERLRAGATPNVLVSDVGMPGQDGYAFVRELRRREAPGAHLPAIALTAFARPQDRETALAAGFDEHCGKPLRPDLLVAAILRVTGAVSPPRR
ncbi:MAG: response regulator [Rhizobacter sp.]